MCAYVCICVCTCVLCKHTHARMLLFKAFYLQECIIYKLRYLSSNLDAFIYYFAFTGTSGTVCNRSGENRHPHFVFDLGGNAASLSLLSVVFLMGFLWYLVVC